MVRKYAYIHVKNQYLIIEVRKNCNFAGLKLGKGSGCQSPSKAEA